MKTEEKETIFVVVIFAFFLPISLSLSLSLSFTKIPPTKRQKSFRQLVAIEDVSVVHLIGSFKTQSRGIRSRRGSIFPKRKKTKRKKKMPAYSGHNQVQSDTNYKNALSSSLSRVANWRTAFTCSTLNEHWMANSQLGAFYTLETHPSSLPQKYDNRRLSYWFQICVCQSAGIVDAVFWECSR